MQVIKANFGQVGANFDVQKLILDVFLLFAVDIEEDSDSDRNSFSSFPLQCCAGFL